MAQSKPHGFDEKEFPFILLKPYTSGAVETTTVNGAFKTAEEIITVLLKDTKDADTIGKKADTINQKYYGETPTTGIYIPITESFQMVAENDFEAVDPASSFSGAVGGAASMVGANIIGINNIVGKFWTGSNIGIGTLSFSVAVDTSIDLHNNIKAAVEQNKEYIDTLKDLFFVKRSPKDIGVLQPPKFCELDSSFGFKRKYIGVKSLKIDTVGMWDSDKHPISYNVQIEIDDMVLGVV